MSIKIQINSLEALERLIGGDTELEIELRHSVAKSLMKKHVKGVLDEEIQKRVKTEISNYLSEKVLGVGIYGSGRISSTYQNTIQEYAAAVVKSEIKSLIEEVIVTNTKVKELRDQVTLSAESLVDRLTEDKLKLMLRREVDKEIMKRLNVSQ